MPGGSPDGFSVVKAEKIDEWELWPRVGAFGRIGWYSGKPCRHRKAPRSFKIEVEIFVSKVTGFKAFDNVHTLGTWAAATATANPDAQRQFYAI